MRKIKFSFFLFLFIVITLYAYAQDKKTDDDNEISPGMEIQKVGDLEIVVPKGAKVRRTGKGGLIFVESASEFMARQLEDMEERFTKIEAEQEALKMEIKALKIAINEITRRSLVTKEKDEDKEQD